MDANSLISQDRNRKLYAELCSKYKGFDAIFKYFISMNEVPRPSGYMQKICGWAMQIGKLLGGECKIDKLGNICIKFPAHPECTSWPGVVLQGHLDMVGTKAADKEFDFTKDTVEMFIDGDLLKANGTTLGADDGTGIATAFAIAEDKTIKRGPLEILCTVDEEVGLEGAQGLKVGELLSKSAKYLINIDSEEWGEICLSCAGAAERLLHFPVVRQEVPEGYSFFKLVLKDFCGGHSGVEIHANRANACRWAAALLSENLAALAKKPYLIDAFEGGNAHNAVPSFCTVVYGVPKEDAKEFNHDMEKLFEAFKVRWTKIETKVPKLIIESTTAPTRPLTHRSSKTLTQQILGVRHGVFRFSEELEDLVETSQSVSQISLKEKELVLDIFARSNTNSRLPPLLNYLDAYVQIHGGVAIKKGTDMCGWPADTTSLIFIKAKEVFLKKYGKEPIITSIHAGLENGVIMSKFPENNIQSISIGPDVKNPHTIDEYVGIQSFCNVFDFVASILPELSH